MIIMTTTMIIAICEYSVVMHSVASVCLCLSVVH